MQVKANPEKCHPADVDKPEQAVKPAKEQPTAQEEQKTRLFVCGCGRKSTTRRALQRHQDSELDSDDCRSWKAIMEPGEAAQRQPKNIRCGCGRRFATPEGKAGI